MENKKIILRFRAANRDIFQAIKNGKKKIETRAASIRNRSIKTGDKLILICGKEKIERKNKKIWIDCHRIIKNFSYPQLLFLS